MYYRGETYDEPYITQPRTKIMELEILIQAQQQKTSFLNIDEWTDNFTDDHLYKARVDRQKNFIS